MINISLLTTRYNNYVAGKWVGVEDVYSSLTAVLAAAEEAGRVGVAERVGLLSAGKRDDWAATRQLLAQNQKNQVTFLLMTLILY